MPARRREVTAKPTIRTDDLTAKFLKFLSRYGNVTKAAQAARVGRQTVYDWRAEDPEFAKAWDEALEEASDVLEGEAFRRAVTGTLEPVYYQGEKVGTVRRYSDSLLTLLLKANRPAKFKDRTDITSGDQPLKAYIGIDLDEV